MIFDGQAFQLYELQAGILELQFNLRGESVNKFNALALTELTQVLDILEKHDAVTGLVLTSGKDGFVVGADVSEFGEVFARGETGIKDFLYKVNAMFNRLEDLPFPTVAAINGFCLGGGMEISLACDFRLLSTNAKVGLPETKLGIIPGWGGTVRLPRLAGLDVAVEWIASGKDQKPESALLAGVADGVVLPEQLKSAALKTLAQAVAGKLDYQLRRTQKRSPLLHNDMEALLAFESAKAVVKAQAGYHYPAPVTAIKAMQDAAKLERDAAQAIETNYFADLAQTSVATNLVGLFLNDQQLTKKVKAITAQAGDVVRQAAVLGAGVMGGGIAYQSAYKGIPIKMKDIAQEGLELGMSEAAELLNKQVERKRITAMEMAEVLRRIEPTLSYDHFKSVDIVVEAVVENPKVKQAVLAEVESHIDEQALLCSNTSSISISYLAEALTRPQNFCGMHFFNPVHRMPLVEVIRGKQTSDATVAQALAYVNALGKKPVVVNDCPGFLVNRVLFPYFAGFAMLLRDGADFQWVDKVMERWGWPMGPAYLMDVVGIDVGVHAELVMANGFPDRMRKSFKAASDVLYEAGRFGQKNGKGFYHYELDNNNKPTKQQSTEAYRLLKDHVGDSREYSEEDIVARMMIPMATEMARCLEEGIVDTVAEADMALIYGLGFPPFRGGIFRWLDQLGVNAFANMVKPLAHLGPLYSLTPGMLARQGNQTTYYAAP